MSITPQSGAAALAAELLLADLPERFAHVAGVASCARAVGHSLASNAETLVAAAWLHDIGYAPSLRSTGFHPLDGARYLARRGFDPEVVSLVAFHSGARAEAGLRGLAAELDDEFAPPGSELLDLLTYCDMTTGPQGQPMTIDERLNEILGRYGPEDVVYRSIMSSAAKLGATVREIEAQVAAAHSQ